MHKATFVVFIFLCLMISPFAQGVKIGNFTSDPDPSAILDIESTSLGVLLPRLTSQERDAITSPANGLIIFNTDCQNLNIYTTSGWQPVNDALLPGVAGTIVGSSIVCIGQSNVPFTIPAIDEASAYSWIYSGTGASVTGTGNSITIDFSETATGGDLTVAGSNACGSGIASSGFSIQVIIPPAAPVESIHSITQTQIVWNWNVVNGADGYKVNTSNDYGSAIDLSTTTSYTQSGLTCGSGYTLYVWAYSSCGASPAAVLTQSTSGCFTCGDSFTDSRDGKVYTTLAIGTQCWMKQNLNYGTYSPVQGYGVQSPGTKFCSNVSGNQDPACPMGGLYIWTNMMNGASSCNGTGSSQPRCNTPVQGICPSGWHIPSHYEWTYLEKNVGSSPGSFPYDITTFGFLGTNEGQNLKQAGSSNWLSGNTGTNASGFTALGTGYSASGGLGWGPYRGFFWTSTQYSANTPIFRELYYSSNQVNRAYSGYDGNISKTGMAVRCVKN